MWVAESAHARLIEEARAAFPHECCGLLLGRFGRIQTVRPARNVHPDPARRFEIDPQTLFDAHRRQRAGGPAVLGYYHSHPLGEPFPSETDQALSAKDGRIWAIVAGEDVMFWEDDRQRFVAQPYELIGSRRSRRELPWGNPLPRLRRWKAERGVVFMGMIKY